MNLTRANLSETNLRGAKLTKVILSKTILTRAILHNARLGETVFADIDLTNVIGLETCRHDGPSILDHRTLARSSDLPLKFLKDVGLTEETIRAYQGEDKLTIEFTSARWGHLTPIEFALRSKLGEAYIVEKDADRIVIKLESPDQFQAALDAVVPVLAALESVSPGESKRLSIEAKEGPSERIENEHLMAVLLYLVHRFEEEHIPSKLTPGQEAVVEAVKGGARGVLGLALQKFFEARAGERENQIYQRFKPAFESLKGVTELPAYEDEPPKQLPPAAED